MKVLYKKPAENPITEYSVRPGTPTDLNLGSIFANDTTQAKINYSLYTQVLAPEPIVIQDSKDDWMISVTKHDLENYFFKVKGDADRINLESINIINVDSVLHQMLHVFSGVVTTRFDGPYSIKSNGSVFKADTDKFNIKEPLKRDSIYTIRLYKLNFEPRSWAYNDFVTLKLPENVADTLNNQAQSSEINNQSSKFVVTTSVFYDDELKKAILRFDNVSNEKNPGNIALRIISVDRPNNEFFVNRPRTSNNKFFGLPISSYISVSGAAIGDYEIFQQRGDEWQQIPSSQIVKSGDFAIEINHSVRDIQKGENRFRAIIDGVGGDKGDAEWVIEARSPGFAIDPLIIPVSMTDIEKELFDNYMSSTGANSSLPIVYESRDIHILPQLSGIDRSMTIRYGVQFVGLNGPISSETWSGNENKGRETKSVPIDTDRIIVTATYEGQEIDRQSFQVAQYDLENGQSNGFEGDNWVVNILSKASPRSGNRYDIQLSIKDKFGKTIRKEDLDISTTTPSVSILAHNLDEVNGLYLVEFQAFNKNDVELIFEIIDPYSSSNKQTRTITRNILIN
jgi:hypothetical protein